MTSEQRSTIFVAILRFLICLSHSFSNAEIIMHPSNTEALVGSSTYFNCSTSSLTNEIHWFHYALGSNADRTFVYGYNQLYPPYQGRFQIENKGGTGNAYNLIIPSVAVQDAGRYECQDDVGRGVKRSGELIVIDTYPACTSNTKKNEVIGPNACGLTPTDLVLTCTVNYTGNESPIMDIGLVGGSYITDERLSRQVHDNRVTYQLTMKGDPSLNGATYKCQTRRSATTPYSCSYGPFTVAGKSSIESCVVGIIILSVLLVLTICGLVFSVIYFWRIKRKGHPKPEEENKAQYQCDVQDDVESQRLLPQQENKPSVETILLRTSHVLEVRVKDLEKRLYPTENIKYEKEPRLIQTISPTTKEKPISGIAILGNELFITSSLSSEVEVYDSTTFIFVRIVNIDRLQDPQDITSCNSNNCLYIAGRVKQNSLENKVTLETTAAPDNQRNSEIENTPEQAYEEKLLNKDNSNEIVKPEPQANKATLNKPKSKSDAGIQPEIKNADKPEIQPLKPTQNNPTRETKPGGKEKSERENEKKSLSKPQLPPKPKFIIMPAPTNEILKIDSTGEISNSWSMGGEHGRLSTYESNVILCISEKQMINEFTADGILLTTVRLSPALGLNHPYHAIKLTSIHFMICHGDKGDKLHQVCVVDLDGNVIKSLREWEKPHVASTATFQVPICIVEDSERSILVADRDNRRVLLFNSILRFQQKFIPEERFEGIPTRLCLNDTVGLLYVAENYRSCKTGWKNGKVLIFKVK